MPDSFTGSLRRLAVVAVVSMHSIDIPRAGYSVSCRDENQGEQQQDQMESM